MLGAVSKMNRLRHVSESEQDNLERIAVDKLWHWTKQPHIWHSCCSSLLPQGKSGYFCQKSYKNVYLKLKDKTLLSSYLSRSQAFADIFQESDGWEPMVRGLLECLQVQERPDHWRCLPDGEETDLLLHNTFQFVLTQLWEEREARTTNRVAVPPELAQTHPPPSQGLLCEGGGAQRYSSTLSWRAAGEQV